MAEVERCRYCLNEACILVDVSRKELSLHPSQFTQTIEYEKGQTLFQEGAPVYGYYIICEGAVKLSRHLSGGKKLIVAVLGPGDILGLEASSQGRFALEAEALEHTRVGFIDKREFARLLERHPRLAAALVEKLSEELGRLQEHLWATLRRGARGRLAYLLLELARTHGRGHSEGVLIDVTLTREELAEMAGVARETASLILSEFQSKGWIASQGRRILIRDRRALDALL
jgi:CRP/FNR family transcriptional regulator